MSESLRSNGATSRSAGTTIAILGAGVMGETLLAAILAAGHDPAAVRVSEKGLERAEELRHRHGVTITDTVRAVESADVVLVAVKPQDVPELLLEMSPALADGATVVSLAAGVRTATLEAALPDSVAVVRAMPNTPALVREGMFGVSAGARCSGRQLETVVELLRAGGEVAVIEESLQDALTAVSGSGPAYVFYLAEQMIAGGVEAGLEPHTARDLVVQTLVGAASLLAVDDADPVELRRRVTSPNGTTAAAIATFDEAGVAQALRAGVLAAARRSAELSDG